MLHLYKLIKVNNVHYEEPYFKMVLAESEEEARELTGEYDDWDIDNEIDLTQKGIIHEEDF